jgi:hypothetical protein
MRLKSDDSEPFKPREKWETLHFGEASLLEVSQDLPARPSKKLCIKVDISKVVEFWFSD